jgi:hypothetical protein
MEKSQVHIDEIKAGDTIEHNGEIRTVCPKNIKRSFIGKSIFGDSYHSGNKLVTKVTFPRFFRGVRVRG